MSQEAMMLGRLLSSPGAEATPVPHVATVTDVSGSQIALDFGNGQSGVADLAQVKAVEGDRVEVQVIGRQMVVTANYTHPTTDDSKARDAQATADAVEDFVGPARSITGDTSGDDAGEGEVTTFSSLEERLGYERTLWDEAVSDSERRVTTEWQRETNRIGQLLTEEYVTNDALVTKTSELADTIDGIQANFTTTVENLATSAQLGEVDEEVTKLTSFVHVTQRTATVGGVEVAYPEMTLGSDDEMPDGTPKQPVKARMTNSGLDFEYKGDVVASIHADSDGRGVLRVANATATDEIQMGSWLIYKRDNGNLSFKYVG